MMIQYASDLHLEFPENADFLKANPLQPVGDILVLAGDIVPFKVMDAHADFFDYVSAHFHTTYWIPGNHEYYHFDISDKSGILHEAIRSNVFLVNNITLLHGAIKFIFTSLWSKISPGHRWQIEREMNDFHLIRYDGGRFSADHYNQLHAESLSFLTQSLADPSNHFTIVATHHVPTFFHYPEKYKGDILNEGFASELYDLIESKGPDYWIFGHHHYNLPDFRVGTTLLGTNQVGYVKSNEHRHFKLNKVINN